MERHPILAVLPAVRFAAPAEQPSRGRRILWKSLKGRCEGAYR